MKGRLLFLAAGALAGFLLCVQCYGPTGDAKALADSLRIMRQAYSADSTKLRDSLAVARAAFTRDSAAGDSTLAAARRIRRSADVIHQKRLEAEALLPAGGDSVPCWLYEYAVEEGDSLRLANDVLEAADDSHRAAIRSLQLAANAYAKLWVNAEGERAGERMVYDQALRARHVAWAAGAVFRENLKPVGAMVGRDLRPFNLPLRISATITREDSESRGYLAAQIVF